MSEATFHRSIYLKTVPPAQALAAARASVDRDTLIREERIPAHEADGRVLSQPVYAQYSAPTFHSAAMDGYAVRAATTFAAREGFPVLLEEGRQAFPVNTGMPLPDGCDAVIMIEQINRESGYIRIEAPAFPWQHVRRIGEDIVATELLFPRHRTLAAWDVGALLASGQWEVPVWERVRVRIIPTGDEVLDFLRRPDPGQGQVVESNSQMLAALIRRAGALPERVPPVRDNPEELHAALCAALDSGVHLVVFCAGSSAGSRDFTRATLEREGTILAHGIAVMPGKPTLVARCRNALAVGCPGYPVSALVCFEEILAPLLAWLGHRTEPAPATVPVRLARSVPSRPGMEEEVCLSIARVAGTLVGMPLARGAGNIRTVTRSQGFVRVPANSEGLNENTVVPAVLRVPEGDLDRVLICIGSHDNILDVLADELMAAEPAVRLASAHVGSMGGITALREGACHFAGMHLYDPETNDFNFPFLQRYLAGTEVAVVNLVVRQQGLIVAPGNPKNIRCIADLPRVRFINRQRGAGTRILLDLELKRAGLDPGQIPGYDHEECTHMAVAVNVLSGPADCGMGIRAAAAALGLDFVPLTKERYDLVVPLRFMDDPRLESLLALVRGQAFQTRIAALGGYETFLSGQIMRPGQGLNAL